MGRALCQSCERIVPDDRHHTCYDAAQVRAIADAERAVVEAAVAFCADDPGDPWGYARDAQHAKLCEEVNHLQALQRGEG